MKKWRDDVSNLQGEEKKEMDRVNKINSSIKNEIEMKRNALKDKHYSVLNDLRITINGFLEKNKHIKQYYPPLA